MTHRAAPVSAVNYPSCVCILKKALSISFRMNKLSRILLFASSYCLKTWDDFSSLRLPSELSVCYLIQATVLLKFMGIAPCSG